VNNQKKSTTGVIYRAWGKEYNRQASMSAGTLKKHCPDIPITLFTDNPHGAKKHDCFDSIVYAKAPVYVFEQLHLSKLESLQQTPYDYTLYLDTDTYIVNDITEIFGVLTKFDIAMCHEPSRINTRTNYDRWGLDTTIPSCFGPFQGGVIAYKKSPVVSKGIKKMIHSYKKNPCPSDQLTFTEQMWKQNLRIYILPPEYNFYQAQKMKEWAQNGFKNAKPKIFHYYGNKKWNIPELVTLFCVTPSVANSKYESIRCFVQFVILKLDSMRSR
jgi:hypothetical protein